MQPVAMTAGSVNRSLSRRQRILESRMFRETFDDGVSFAGKLLVMWLRYADDASLRLGVVASKKVFRRSVDRVRARRLLREAYRLNRYRLKDGVDVVLIARRRIGVARMQEVEKEILQLAGEAGILLCGDGRI